MKISLEDNDVCGEVFFAKKIAFAIAKVLCIGTQGAFLLGCDGASCPKELCDAVYEGLRLGGAYIYMLGNKELPIASEAEMRYLCDRSGICGIMITPSEILCEGELKIFFPNGTELPDEKEEEIEENYISLPRPFECILPTESRLVLCDAKEIYERARKGAGRKV